MTTTETPMRPGGAMASRPLHFIWICDCSGSMIGTRIQSLNQAIREAIPAMREVADENANAQVLVRALAFSDMAEWHISQPVKIEEFEWTDLTAGGMTFMGLALKRIAEQMKLLPERGLPPVLVLISDGEPTDDFKSGLNELMGTAWGKKAVRVAIAIGNEANFDILQKFIGHPEIRPHQAHKANDLVKLIKWASTATIQAASSPVSQVVGGARVETNMDMLQNPVLTDTSTPVPSASDEDFF